MKSGDKCDTDVNEKEGNIISAEVVVEEQDTIVTNLDVQWESVASGFHEDGNWATEKDARLEKSPPIWDPNAFDQQAPSSWTESKEPKRIQDLPSPLLVEPEPDQRRSASDEEEWPFKSPCKMEEKKKKRMSPKPDNGGASDIDSEEESPKTTTNGDKFRSGSGVHEAPSTIKNEVSAESDEDDDIAEDIDDMSSDAWKKRESSKSSSYSSDAPSNDKDNSKRGRKKDSGPSVPRRSRGGRPDADEEEMDEPPAKPKKVRGNSADGEEELVDHQTTEKDGVDRPKKPRRRDSKQKMTTEDDEEEGLEQGSFHGLTKDFDKKPMLSSSRGRKIRTPSSSGSGDNSGRRRRVKDKAMDHSGHSVGDDDIDEFGEEEHEMKLKDEADSTPGSGSGRKGWRDRRIKNRMSREHGLGEGQQPLQAPGSGGRRPPSSRRAQMRRTSSERWMRAVEGVDVGVEGSDSGRTRSDTANTELSRSAHAVRRYNSGGVNRMSAGLGTASYHGMEERGRRTPSRRTPRKATHTPNSDNSGGSFGQEDYEYDMNLSGRSARTLDSIEDLEDFEHIDFQTPGMIDYDEEMLDLMQRANPEHTAQLQRRVGRRREAVNYDQNMPMMTKQALMTRTASTMVQRQYVDQSTIDKKRMLVRSMSNSSMASNDELSQSQHRQQFSRGGPSRRPPPRTKSSGMAALSRSEHPYNHGAPRPEPDRRGVSRTKSGTSTSSFRYNQKPNRVQSLSRRPAAAEGLDSGSRHGPPDERKGSLSRAKSMHATVGRSGPRSLSPKKPERRMPKSIDTKPSKAPPRESEEEHDDSSSASEASDVETDDDTATASPEKLSKRKAPVRPLPPKATPPPPRKKTDKRDFTIKRNRCKLHYTLYGAKMEVDMKDLLKQVQQGEIPRSPIHTLMMPSP